MGVDYTRTYDGATQCLSLLHFHYQPGCQIYIVCSLFRMLASLIKLDRWMYNLYLQIFTATILLEMIFRRI
jgi:hypothetical protein